MSGPIVRTGATPEFSENWDRIFGGKSKQRKSGTKKAASKSARSSAKKSTKTARSARKAKKR